VRKLSLPRGPCSACLPLAVLRFWPLLYCRCRATSCWIQSHASSPPCPDLFPLPYWPSARAPRLHRASTGRHLLVAVESSPKSLNSQSLTRNSMTLTPTLRSFSPIANSRAPNPNSTAALSSSTPVTTGHRGQRSQAIHCPR
jgi:hypothetical protein